MKRSGQVLHFSFLVLVLVLVLVWTPQLHVHLLDDSLAVNPTQQA